MRVCERGCEKGGGALRNLRSSRIHLLKRMMDELIDIHDLPAPPLATQRVTMCLGRNLTRRRTQPGSATWPSAGTSYPGSGSQRGAAGCSPPPRAATRPTREPFHSSRRALKRRSRNNPRDLDPDITRYTTTCAMRARPKPLQPTRLDLGT